MDNAFTMPAPAKDDLDAAQHPQPNSLLYRLGEKRVLRRGVIPAWYSTAEAPLQTNTKTLISARSSETCEAWPPIEVAAISEDMDGEGG
jgi:hypothetical protein